MLAPGLRRRESDRDRVPAASGGAHVATPLATSRPRVAERSTDHDPASAGRGDGLDSCNRATFVCGSTKPIARRRNRAFQSGERGQYALAERVLLRGTNDLA